MHIIVQVGFDRETNDPLYQVARRVGDPADPGTPVYAVATGAENPPADYMTVARRIQREPEPHAGEQAQALAETWINGNRSDAIRAIHGSTPARAAYLAARVYEYLQVREEQTGDRLDASQFTNRLFGGV